MSTAQLVSRLASPRLPSGLTIVFASLTLLACGSSSSGAGSSASSSSTSSSSSSSSSGSALVPSGCHAVGAPAPKGSRHVPRPTLRLDPSKRYVVRLTTNCGPIDIQLDVKRAPRTSASFAALVKRGFYDNLTFHRVALGFVIQGGDPVGNGVGGPGYTIVERPPANLQYTAGTVAMAKTTTAPSGSSGSQFFIVLGSNIELPPQYALLGKVVGGQSTVSAISHVPVGPGPGGESSAPKTPMVISRASLSIG